MTANQRLRDLIESGELDWDNPRHREAFLRAWVNGNLPSLPVPEENPGE